MVYVPNASDLLEPTTAREVISAALEFRTLKARLLSLDTDISDFQTQLDALQAAIGAGTDSTALAANLNNGTSLLLGDALLATHLNRLNAKTRSQHEKNEDGISFLDFCTSAQISDIRAGTLLVDLDVPLQDALDTFGGGYEAGELYFPLGGYRWAAARTIPGRVSLRGCGIGTVFAPATDGFILLDNATVGGTFLRDFYLRGVNSALYTGISTVPGTNAAKWLQGLGMSGLVISQFLTGVKAKNLRHALIQIITSNCCTGLQVLGQSVSLTIHASKFTSGISTYGDGTMGVEIVASNAYSDAVSRQPEAIKIVGESLVYGYDTCVSVKNCINFVAQNSDFDTALKWGIRVASVTGGCTIKDNYIACLHQPGLVVTGLQFDNPGAPVNSPIWVEDNNFQFYGTVVGGSTALKELGNRTGIFKISGNMLGGGSAAAVALALTSPGVQVADNFIYGTGFSLTTEVGSYGHSFTNNWFLGTILRDSGSSGLDYFFKNKGTVITGYHGPVTVTAGAGPKTITLASLGLASNPIIGANSYFSMKTQGYQFTGGTWRGAVGAVYDNAGNIVVNYTTALGVNSGDIWVDMEPT